MDELLSSDLSLEYLRELRGLVAQIAADVLLTQRQLADWTSSLARHTERTNARLLELEAQVARFEPYLVQLAGGINHRLDGANGRLDRIKEHLGMTP
jgi:hypothetical protein